MSYKRVRAYLFRKSYAYSVFTNRLRKAKRRDKAALNRRLQQILLLGQTLHTSHIPRVRSLVRKDEKLTIYVHIEKELIRLVDERKNQGEFDLEEYESALLDPAIERVAGASLSDIEDDIKFDTELMSRKSLYQHWYYQTAAKYSLPTLRIIPFLLRLLQPTSLTAAHQ